MTSIQPASLFDSREALAGEGEIDRKEALTRAATGSAAIALDADNELAKAGYDKNGNRLGSDDKPIPSEDIMSNRKRSMMPRNANDESNWLTIAANKGGEMKPSAGIEAEIDAARAYTIAFAKHCNGFAEPCDQKRLLARIDAGLLLLADARSQYHVNFLAFTIKSDCDALGIKTIPDLAVAIGCSTSAVYTKIGDGSFEFALAVIAAERQLTIREARKAKWREIDIERAIRGSRFDAEGIRGGIKLAPLSLKIEVAHAIAREAMASALTESGVKDKSTHMIPRSRWKKLAEIGLFDVNTFETLSQLKPQERDDWIADREVERLKALFGNDQQRRAARCRYDSRECQRLIRKHVGMGERFAPTKPNVPPSLSEIAKRCTQKHANKKAA